MPQEVSLVLLTIAGILLSILWACVGEWMQRLPNSAAHGDIDKLCYFLQQNPRKQKVAEASFSAIFCKQDQSLDVLLEHGVDLESELFWGGTPLHVAARVGSQFAVERLVQGSTSINLDLGGTPLFWAADQGNITNVKLLLQLGADPKLIDIEKLGKSSFAPVNIGGMNNETNRFTRVQSDVCLQPSLARSPLRWTRASKASCDRSGPGFRSDELHYWLRSTHQYLRRSKKLKLTAKRLSRRTHLQALRTTTAFG